MTFKNFAQKIFSVRKTNGRKRYTIKRMVISFFRRKFIIKLLRTSNEKNKFIDYVLNNQLDKSNFVPITNNAYDWNNNKTKLIAFYLPQYHNFPENEEYFGKGFTEWTNVTKAVPQCIGHYQPHLPIDVGFYNLETTDIMKRQIELAHMYGIYGFCFYYYWFSGKKVMNKPIEMLLADKSLDIPFYIFWANEDWTRLWDDGSGEILYKCEIRSKDAQRFMSDVLPLMKDDRYIKINGKPLLTIYNLKRYDLKILQEFIANLRKIAKENGFEDLYIMVIRKPYMNIYNLKEYIDRYQIDAIMEFIPGALSCEFHKKFALTMNDKFHGSFFDTEKYVAEKNYLFDTNCTLYKGCFPHWDNTPRKCYNGAFIFEQSPQNYKIWLKDIIKWTQKHNKENEQFVFINAWNEWGEGAHLEPDRKYGYAYLQATKEALEETYEL